MQKLRIILEIQKLTAGIKWKYAVLVPHLFPWLKLKSLFKNIDNYLSFKLEMLSCGNGFLKRTAKQKNRPHGSSLVSPCSKLNLY